MGDSFAQSDMPVELYHVIASHSEGTYKALLALPPFARSIDVNIRYDYMILFGYHVTIGKRVVQWYRNGQLHRADGPAVEHAIGTRMWRQNGRYHRVDGPAVEYASGAREWYQNGELHRVGGPAIEHADGTLEWWQNGQRHRVDGPVVEYADGTHRLW